MGRDRVDFVIIGAGAAGGVVAKELAEAGFRVVVLEQGPRLGQADFVHDEIWSHDLHGLTNDHRLQPNTRRTDESEVATAGEDISLRRMWAASFLRVAVNKMKRTSGPRVLFVSSAAVQTALNSSSVRVLPFLVT